MDEIGSFGNSEGSSPTRTKLSSVLPEADSPQPLSKYESDWGKFWQQCSAFFSELPKKIYSNSYFYGFYGFLDGVSVAYSTIKFSCDLLSKDLDSTLTDWFALIIACTAIAATVSTIGSYSLKTDFEKQHYIEKQCRIWLPYIRDALKGGKNGYKAIKTCVMVLVHHQMLDAANVRAIALPIGLAFSFAAVINRYLIRVILDEKKRISTDIESVSKKLQKANELQLELTSLQAKLFSFQIEIDALERLYKNKLWPEENATPEQVQELEKQRISNQAALERCREKTKALQEVIANKTSELSGKNITTLIDTYNQLFQEKVDFIAQNYYWLLGTKALGGFIDAPYLYLGVMSLVVLSMPAFIVTSSILSVFLVACVAVRFNEGSKALQELEATAKLAELDVAISEFNYQQERILELHLANFKKFKSLNRLFYPKNEIIQLFEDYKNRTEKEGGFKETWDSEIDQLHELFIKVDKVNDELKTIVRPTYQMAILEGMQDGLSAFGALASTYFLLGICFLITGVAFPPALIVVGAIFGLASIAGFVAVRLNQLQHDLAHRDTHYLSWKQYNNKNLQYQDTTEHLLLSPLDCNTDGLTKGEFFWQRQFEIVRCFTNGPYKAENLTDFVLNELDDHFSKIIAIFWGVCSLVYCAVLALRAVAQMAKDKKYQPLWPDSKASGNSGMSIEIPVLPKPTPDRPQKSPDKIARPSVIPGKIACLGVRNNFFAVHGVHPSCEELNGLDTTEGLDGTLLTRSVTPN